MLGKTDLRLWPRPRSELRARRRNPLSPPILLGEARIRRKRSLELRLRLAWGARIALFSRGEGQGQLGTRAQSTGACRKRVLKGELGGEKRPGKKKGGRRAREKGRDANRPGEGRTKSWLGPGAGRKWVPRERSKGGERPASHPRVPVPSLESNRCCLRRWEGKTRLGRRRGRAPAAERSPGLPHQTAVPDSGPSSS